METFAMMGINSAMIQAAVLTRGKVNALVPAKIAARLDITEGNFKIEALPITAPEYIGTLL